MYLHRRDHKFSIKEKYNINPVSLQQFFGGPLKGPGTLVVPLF